MRQLVGVHSVVPNPEEHSSQLSGTRRVALSQLLETVCQQGAISQQEATLSSAVIYLAESEKRWR